MKISRITTHTRHFIFTGIATSCLLFAIIGVFAFTQTKPAQADAGKGYVNGGGCYVGKVGRWWDSCYGVTWRYYKWGTRSNTLVEKKFKKSATTTVDGTPQAPGGPIRDCRDAKGIYILGFEAYKRTDGGVGNTPGTKSLGYQRGIVKNKNVALGNDSGQGYNFVVARGSSTWAQTRADYIVARREGQVGQYTHFKNGNLGWFCYSPKDDDPKEPTQSTTIVRNPGDIETKSKVSVNAQADVSAHELTSDFDDTVKLHISTNEEKLKINFEHFYHPTGGSKIKCESSPEVTCANNIELKWDVKWTSGVRGDDKKDVASGSFNADTIDKVPTPVSSTQEYEVELQPGENNIFCQTIRYSPKFLDRVERTVETKDPTTGAVTGRTREISIEGHGADESSACIAITRIEDPTIPHHTYDTDGNVKVSGIANGDVVYAGEGASVQWTGKYKSYRTRRFAGVQGSIYDVDRAYDRRPEGYDKGTPVYRVGTSNKNTCDFFKEQKLAKTCEPSSDLNDIIDDNTENPYELPDDDEIDSELYAIVPDSLNNMSTIGDKYCGGLGYKFEYWFGEQRGRDEYNNIHWQREDDKTYWTIFRPSCRTIAKKPSLAIWNGAFYTPGSIKTSLSDRYDIANRLDNQPDTNSTRTLYGSWSEHLNNVKNRNTNFASGSALYQGLPVNLASNDPISYSPLTISNASSEYGYSGVSPASNSLLDYLKNKLAKDGGSTENAVDNTFRNITPGNNVYKFEGSQKITANITLPDNAQYDSISKIPQNVIIVNGDLQIDSDVTRIDAWLLVTGKIDTCYQFKKQTTGSNGECSKQLMINGPVIANQFIPHRSYGADPAQGSKANSGEILNLRQDTYLWAYAMANQLRNNFQEVYAREIAPRY